MRRHGGPPGHAGTERPGPAARAAARSRAGGGPGAAQGGARAAGRGPDDRGRRGRDRALGSAALCHPLGGRAWRPGAGPVARGRRPGRQAVPAGLAARGGRAPPAELARRVASASPAVLLDPAGPVALSTMDFPAAGDIMLIVGPEGGVSPAETEELTQAGAVTARLGPTVLRTSSAGLVAAAVVASRCGRWR